MKKKRICIITGSRGEYGALRWLLKDFAADPTIDLKLVVMGSHWLKEYGYTYREILKDGLRIDARISIPFDTRSPVSLAHAAGTWTAKLSDIFKRLAPDLVLIGGDRYELLSICTACLLLSIPVAHISGGEITTGAIDEQVRHAVTKMSHIHFTGNPLFAKRLRQMGEEPWRVHVTGEPGLDTLRRLPALSKGLLSAQLKLNLSKPTALCTFHPVTLESHSTVAQIREYLRALAAADLQYVLTYPNADHGSRQIIALLKSFAKQHPKTVRLVPHLGQHAYLSLMYYVRLMIGNSSSGIWEAPSLDLPVVNIGNRQQGRLRGHNVIDVPCQSRAIRSGIQKALKYRRSRPQNPYGDGHSSKRIIAGTKNILKRYSKETLLKKKFITQGAH